MIPSVSRFRPTVLAVGMVLVTAMTAGLGAHAQTDPLSWVYPSDGQLEVSPGTSIHLRLEVQANPDSLANAFELKPAVTGTWQSSDHRNFTYVPDDLLAPETAYTATIGVGLLDTRGNPVFQQPRVWSFTTGQDNVEVSFGGGVPLLYVDPTGKRAIPVNSGYARTTLEVIAYSLDVRGFAERYGELEAWQSNKIDVNGLSEAARWTERIDTTVSQGTIVLPGAVAPGLYVLDAGGERVRRGQALVIVASHKIVAKTGLDGLTAWVSTVPAGTPAPDARVVAHDAAGAPLAEARTRADGVAADIVANGALFLTAEVDGETAVVGLDDLWRSGWWWGWRFDMPADDEVSATRIARYAGHIHTDRPIYRPGHAVHWKATLRALGSEGYLVPEASTAITATIRDAGGNLVARVTTVADDFGSINGDLRLDTDAALGTWQLQIQVGPQTFYGQFQVEEYVKPDYEVLLSTDRPWYVAGDSALVAVQADYYFGQPVTDAEVVVRVYEHWTWRGDNRPIHETTGRTDSEGAFEVEVPLNLNHGQFYGQSLWMEASVTDASRRPVTANTTTIVHPAEFALRLENERYGVEIGQPVSYTAVAVDHDGTPMPGVAVAVEIGQYHRNGMRTLETRNVTTGPDGRAQVTFSGLRAGWYSVEARASDSRGNAVTANSYAWVWDGAQPWYWYGGLEIELDRDSYSPGDTAQLLIKSPYTTTALVTVEREAVYTEQVVELRGATTIELPIEPEFAPNATVTVAVWQDIAGDYNRAEGQLVLAQRNIVVPADDRRLTVSIEPTLAETRPGDMATFTLRVTDATGAPVRAQASVAVVDKAVLALARDTSGDIFDAFWQGWPTTVGTYDSLKPAQGYAGFPELARGGDGGASPAPGGPAPTPAPAAADDDDDDDVQATPRRFFPDTALWEAAIVTDADGTATIVMPVPDTLTTWVALARAVTLDARAGQGRGELLVTQPIIADIALPRFAVQGDHFALDVLGRNYADATAALAASCALEAPGLTLLDGSERQMDLPFNRTVSARYSVVASTLGSSPVTARLGTHAGADAIELPLEIVPFTVPSRFASAGSVDSGKVFERFNVPFHAVPEASRVELRLASGVAQSVLDGVEDLVGFPYGCVEQTMSRMLPNAIVGRLVETLGVELGPELGELPEMMNIGLQKLYGFQNPSGGWGWWHWSSSDSQVYMTAYVLHGLLLARDAGYAVDAAAIDRGFQWLGDGAKPSEPGDRSAGTELDRDPRILAYAAYVMSLDGRDDDGLALRLMTEADGWDPFALASLAMALHAQGEIDGAAAVAIKLKSQVETTATSAFWPMATADGQPMRGHWDWYQWRTMASSEKYTAMAMQALQVVEPESELLPRAARWLLAHRHGRGWNSTHATAFAVLGLTDYVIASGELQADYSWQVALDGAVIRQGAVNASNVLEPIEPIVLSGGLLRPGEHDLVIEKTGQGTLFYTLFGRMAEYHDGFVETEAEGLGISIRREYLPVAGRAGADGWAVGDLINVRLTLNTTEDLGYLIVEDMLPAGFEPLNERLETEGRVPGASPWRWWGYERRELRDQKVTFFQTWVPAGSHSFEYAARAVTPGEFSARPAEAYPMYRPEVWGRSSSARVEVDSSRITQRPDLRGDFDRDCRLTAFDASLIASDWGKLGQARDVNGDGVISVADIAIANGRAARDLACGDTVPPLPPAAGSVELIVREAASSGAAGEMVLELVVAGGLPIGAWEATLSLPAGLRHLATDAGPRLPDAFLLEPVQAGGQLRLGGWSATDGRAGDVLASITLRAEHGDGGSAIGITSAELTTAEGGVYEVTVDGEVISPPAPSGLRIWLPFVAREAILR